MSLRTISTRTSIIRPSSLSLFKHACAPRNAFYSTKLAAPLRPAGLFLARSQSANLLPQQQIRFGSSGSLGKEDIQRRILEVLSTFEKCDPAKINPTASFTSDLGLDSLDAVEVVMAIEEEFSIEIPDEEADKITTVSEAISYIERTPEAI
ncbi:hypothetical protein CROQUDRAFT_663602 [Cronartium quercuum f. sp. fusiforme G11]|uniref:Acyl carrier protein n=1 Tax=Cronartium quercuum f. sp. fusiforme G11 TaxID=708437 RepID=A0A9P6T7J7_9BASI|nr:hypothetical protein CROQUDRAFT_663602 [Cronartium quercuum f. sp. fusiforme G11]